MGVILNPTIPAKRRALHLGDTGRDVKAAGRALRKALRKHRIVPVGAATGTFGKGMLADVLRFQKVEKLPQDGKVNVHVWVALDPSLDRYGQLLLTPKPKPEAPPGQRVAHEMEVLLLLAPVQYSQRRPAATTTATWRAEGGDCSGTAYLACKNAGVYPDWSGIGNTATEWANGIHVSNSNAALGDHMIYGLHGVTDHVQVVTEFSHGIVWTVGHGSAGGPRKLPVSYRLDPMGYVRFWP